MNSAQGLDTRDSAHAGPLSAGHAPAPARIENEDRAGAAGDRGR